MQVIADLQLHSRFSRAVSPQMTISTIATWARRKGIDVVATGDWTHPIWFREIERDLEEMGNGLLKLRAQVANENFDPSSVSSASHTTITTQRENEAGQNFVVSPHERRSPLFLLATEVSCIYSQGGKVRRVHTLIWVPTLDSARKISREMTKQGCNLLSDGRPIVGLTSIQIAELVFTIEPKALIIPAHAWTPWFAVYGSLGGFDSIQEAFGPYADQIYAVETGLSSNPSMNWRIRELDTRAIVSFSDAHSGPKLGREATVFDLDELSYASIYQAIKAPSLNHRSGIMNQGDTTHRTPDTRHSMQQSRIAYTIEFYPEEGKYHYTGHRACHVRQTPEETRAKGTACPVCGKPLTVGVMHRVEALAARTEESVGCHVVRPQDPSIQAVMYGSTAFPTRPPFVMLVPLQEIIAEAIGSPVTSPKVQMPYMRLTSEVGNEFDVLLRKELDTIARVAGTRVADGVSRMRKGNLHIDPGYDGVFGVVKIWGKGEKGIGDSNKEQLSLL